MNGLSLSSVVAGGLVLLATAGQVQADYAATVVADNPVAYWRLNEASGIGSDYTATDSIAGNHDGSYSTNGLTYGQTGAIGDGSGNKAVRFSGTNNQSFISVPNDPALNPSSGAFAVEAWAKFNPYGSGTEFITVVSSIYDNYHYGFEMRLLRTATNSVMRWGVNDGTGAHFIASTTQIGSDQWYHFVGTYDIASGAANLYVNGVLNNSSPNLPGGYVANATSSFMIGGGYGNGAQYNMKGLLDEVAFYNTALSADRVAAHYQASVPEPASVGMLVVGGTMLMARRK